MMSGTGAANQEGVAGAQALNAPLPTSSSPIQPQLPSSQQQNPPQRSETPPYDKVPTPDAPSSQDDSEKKDSASVDLTSSGDSNDSGEKTYRATFYDLFIRFASPIDLTMNAAGIVAAVAAGAAQPLMTIVFGNLTSSFLQYSYSLTQPPAVQQAAKETLQDAVAKDALLLVYIGIAMFGATYIYSSTWVYTGEEITRRFRETFFAAILKQEIAYFDKEGAGSITTRLQSDTHLIQDGISDKVPMSVMFIATFITGFVVAYIRR